MSRPRYRYEADELFREDLDGSHVSIPGYSIIDGLCGHERPIAFTENADDAERIVAALNRAEARS